MIQITPVTSIEDLQPYREAWNNLAERSDIRTIFQTFEWHKAWWEGFGEGAGLFVLLAHAGDTLVGVAPLLRSRRRKPLSGRKRWVVEIIGAGASDYRDFIVDRSCPEARPALYNWLLANRQQWEILDLADLPHTSPTLADLPIHFEQRGCPSETRRLYDAPTRLFNNPEEDAKIPRKKSLRRHYNYFNQRGTLECTTCTTAETIAPYLETFFQQHIERWQQSSVESQFLNERERVFYRAMVRSLAPTGWLAFAVVRFEGNPIAFHLGFTYGERFTWYKPAFDIAYAKHSPGEVLIKYLFEYALERKVAEFDFTIGQESFKYRFANHIRQNYGVLVFRDPPTYRLYRLLYGFKIIGKMVARQHPDVAGRIRRLLKESKGMLTRRLR